jgi:D-sedoheptulose 7-phosphate isomerase
MTSIVREQIGKSRSTLDAILADEELLAKVEKAAMACADALRRGNKILFAGNGGSAADAQHLAGELVCRLNFERHGLAGIALTADTAALTAIANDYGYEKVFARQIDALGREGDVFFGISTSGRSPNILLALEESRRRGLVTIGFTGGSGGGMPPLCDHCLCIPSEETQKIQEAYMVLGHIVCGITEREIFAP